MKKKKDKFSENFDFGLCFERTKKIKFLSFLENKKIRTSFICFVTLCSIKLEKREKTFYFR